MLQQLEYFVEKSPTNIHVRSVLDSYMNKVEKSAVQIDISRIETNPFVFTTKLDIEKEIGKSFSSNFINPHLEIRTIQSCQSNYNSIALERTLSSPIGQGSSLDFPNTSMRNVQTQAKRWHENIQNKSIRSRTSREFNNSHKLNTHNHSNLSALTNNRMEILEYHQEQFCKKIMAKVTHLQDPGKFYIQQEENLDQLRGITNKYIHFETYQNRIPRNIEMGMVYMVHYNCDKQWYRCLAVRTVSKDLYEAFLVDIGKSLEIESKAFRDLDPQDAQLPYAAVLCTLYDLLPIDEKWSNEAINFFMSLTKK